MIADTDTTTPVAAARLLRRPPGRLHDGRDRRLHDPARAVRARPAVGVPQRLASRPGSCSTRTPGLTINDFAGGVQFFHTLPSLDRPDAAAVGAASRTPTNITPDNWLATVKQQVVTPVQGEPREPGPERLGRRVHVADDDHRLGDDLLDLHVEAAVQRPGDDRDLHRREDPRRSASSTSPTTTCSVSGRLYADLSNISLGAATVLFLADVPDQVRILTLYGKLQMGFKNVQGQEVTFAVPDLPPDDPTATLGGPADGGDDRRGRAERPRLHRRHVHRPDRSTGSTTRRSPTSRRSSRIAVERAGHGHPRLDAGADPHRRRRRTRTATGSVSQGTTRRRRMTLTPIDSAWALVDNTSGNTLREPGHLGRGVLERRLVAPRHAVRRRRPRADREPDRRRLDARRRRHVFSQNGSTLPITDRRHADADPGYRTSSATTSTGRSRTARSTSRSRRAPGATPRSRASPAAARSPSSSRRPPSSGRSTGRRSTSPSRTATWT